MYLDRLIHEVRRNLPDGAEWPGDSEELVRLYALLARTVGSETTLENVHDAWSLWQSARDSSHPSLVPFAKLPPELQATDEPFRTAIVRAAAALNPID